MQQVFNELIRFVMYVGFTNRELMVCYFNALITDKRLIRNKGKYSSIAQSVEQRTVNPWVVGSSPTWGARKRKKNLKFTLDKCRMIVYYSQAV